jgi:hypothetical protein
MRPLPYPLVLLALLLVTVTTAHAAPRPPAGVQSLGIAPAHGVSAIAGAPPSLDQPLGTLLVTWCESPLDAPTVRLGEWSLQSSRWLAVHVVRRQEHCPVTLRMVWSRQRIVLGLGNDAAGETELVVLERAAARFTEVQAITFENAEAPSLDADEHRIALATYERRTPLVAAGPTSRSAPPAHALHVRVLDPATLQIRGARVFCGAHLLRRHANPDAAGHAIRLLGDRLYVAVADDDPHVVATRLPSLATEVERTFAVPQHLRTPSSSSIVLNRLGETLVVGVGATHVLSARLDEVATSTAAPTTGPIAYDAASRRVLATDGASMTLDGWRVRVIDTFGRKEGPYSVDGEALGVVFAHGRGVVLGALYAPGPSARAPTWAIRIVP